MIFLLIKFTKYSLAGRMCVSVYVCVCFRNVPAINYIAVNQAKGTHRMSKPMEIIISESGRKHAASNQCETKTKCSEGERLRSQSQRWYNA